MLTKKQFQLLESRVAEADKLYKGTRYHKVVTESNVLLSKSPAIVSQRLAGLPCPDKMLSKLVEKLKGKSVYSTLKLIEEGKCNNPYTVMKGLLSLATHTCIEVEQGKPDYRILLNRVCEKIQELLPQISDERK